MSVLPASSPAGGPGQDCGRAVRRATGWPDEARRFADRAQAGKVLAATVADLLADTGAHQPLVLGLPRGGVPVAREIAKALVADLDVVVAHRVGLPWRPAMTVGAIAGDGPPLFDRNALACADTQLSACLPAVGEVRREVERRERRYRGGRPGSTVSGRTVIIADDGLAPSVFARAAVRTVRAGGPASVLFAAPVCAAECADWLGGEADVVLHLHSPRVFHALGLWYRDVTPVTDDEVATILRTTWDETGVSPVEANQVEASPVEAGQVEASRLKPN